MTQYEQWSLALTALGHLFVAASILYAARQWLIAQKSLKREIDKDTRAFISEMEARISSYQKEIIDKNITQESISASAENSLPVRQLLNTLESMAYEVEAEFYDRVVLEKYVSAQAAFAFSRWRPFIMESRMRYNSADLWGQLELLAARYNKSLHGTR